MLALHIPNVKNFMNGMLVGNLFDPFLMIEGSLVTAISYTFDGHLNREFYPPEERSCEMHPYEYQPWSESKQTLLSLIKGNNTPICMRFMLQLMPEKAEEMLKKASPDTDFSQLKSLILNIKYENGTITLTTGTSYNTFVMSHDADIIWDRSIQKYLSGKGVEFDLL